MNNTDLMENYVYSLSDAERKKYRNYAICAAVFNCFGDLLQSSSAILMLYYRRLGATESLTMFQTAFPGIASLIGVLLVSGLVAKCGPKLNVYKSANIATVSFLMMVFQPYMGWFGKYWISLWCVVYCFAGVYWGCAWFPLLTFILLPKERASFFGMMRFTYSLIIGFIFFLVGMFMKRDTPTYVLQIILVCVGVLVWGRWFFISKIPIPQVTETKKYEIRKGFGMAIRNAPLVMFNSYVCFMMFAMASVSPFTILYMKQYLNCGDDWVQILSSLSIVGNMAGYFLFKHAMNKFGRKRLNLILHFCMAAIPFILFFCGKNVPYVILIISVILFLNNMIWAMFYAGVSTEMLALSKPGNVSMSTAMCQIYQNVGQSAGRAATSVLIGGNILAQNWSFGTMCISKYQSVYLILGCIAIACTMLIFCLPSMVSEREIYYKP